MENTLSKKKLAFGIMSLTLALSAVTACGQDEKPGPEKVKAEQLERQEKQQESINKAEEGNQNIKESKPVKAPPPPAAPNTIPKKLQEEVKKMKVEKPPTSIVSDKGAQRNLPKAPVGQGVPQDKNKQPAGGSQGTPNTLSINGATTGIIATDPIKKNGQWVFSPTENVKYVSWYQGSAEPLGKEGNNGSVVISGHINNVSQGTGFAAKFSTLKPGDIVTIVNAHGKKIEYKVKTNKQIKKNSGLPPEVNRETGPESLVLITCSGAFIGGDLGYQDNSIIEAFPLS